MEATEPEPEASSNSHSPFSAPPARGPDGPAWLGFSRKRGGLGAGDMLEELESGTALGDPVA